jgi:hydrogenase 3 maturation protease
MTLERQLRQRLKGKKVVVVGVGNPLRGDDAAGCRVANKLKETPCLRVIIAEEVPENYFGLVTKMKPDTVVFVDAVELGMPPGAVALVEKDDIAGHMPTTHRMPLSILMSLLARETGADVFLLAVQPYATDFGMAVSREVELSSALLANAIEEVALPDTESLS